RHQHRLVSGSADLEEDLVLPLELDLLVIQLARQVHRPVDVEEGLLVEPLELVDGLCGQGGPPESAHSNPDSALNSPARRMPMKSLWCLGAALLALGALPAAAAPRTYTVEAEK